LCACNRASSEITLVISTITWTDPSAPQAALDFDHTSHADFGAATHPGVGGGTHRRRATFERCSVLVGGVSLGFFFCRARVCAAVGGVFSVGVLCACDLFIVLHDQLFYVYICKCM